MIPSISKYLYSYIIILFVTGIPAVVFAQKEQDSLLKVVNKNISNNAKADAWNGLSKISFHNEAFDTALIQAQKALLLSQKAHYRKGEAYAASNIANVYLMQSKFKEAIEYNQQSLMLYQQIHDPKGQCKTYSNIGIVYFRLNLYPKALHSFFEALKLDIKLNDSIGIAQDYRDIGMVKTMLEKPEEALNFYQRALSIQEKLKDEENVAITLSNIAIIYTRLNRNEEAITYFQKAIHILEKNGNSNYGLSYFFNGIGIAYKNIGAYDKAIGFYKKSLALKQTLQDKNGMADVYNNIGKLYLLKNNIQEGKIWLNKALTIAKENNIHLSLMQAYLNLSNADSLSGNYKSALYHYQQSVIYKDSIFNDDNKNRIAHLQMDYEFSQKEDSLRMNNQKEVALKEAALATQKREKWFLLAGLILLAIIGVLLLYQNKTHQRNNRNLAILNKRLDREATQNQLLTKEMHHRIKNNLFMVYSLLNIQEHNSSNPETKEYLSDALQRIDSIATLHEQLYRKEPGNINLKDYLTKFVDHLRQQFMNERTLQVNIAMEDNIKTGIFLGMPIAMLINEWLTNSVKYACTKTSALEIYIKAYTNDGKNLFIEYSDNGKTDLTSNPANHSGIGKRIIHLLCKQIKGTLEINFNQQPYHYQIKIPL